MLTLVQGYYRFLSLGKLLEQMIITNDLSELAMDLPISTGEKSFFVLKKTMLEKLLSDIHQHPNKRNVFGYLVEISAFKGIFSVMREMIDSNISFRNFLNSQLKDQYFAFEQLIRFLRNVLNHATSSGVVLKLEDFEKQKEFLHTSKIKNPIIDFNFLYGDYIAQRKGSSSYGMHITLNFDQLKPGTSLETLISRHELYLLSELCFNLSQLAEAMGKKSSPPSKINKKPIIPPETKKTSPLGTIKRKKSYKKA